MIVSVLIHRFNKTQARRLVVARADADWIDVLQQSVPLSRLRDYSSISVPACAVESRIQTPVTAISSSKRASISGPRKVTIPTI